jgi:hypothetical protein
MKHDGKFCRVSADAENCKVKNHYLLSPKLISENIVFVSFEFKTKKNYLDLILATKLIMKKYSFVQFSFARRRKQYVWIKSNL